MSAYDRDHPLCAVVLAAGSGTRLAPLTRYLPKVLCPVNNQPLLDRALGELAQLGLFGPDRVAVNAHHQADKIVDAVGERARLSVEPEPLGTAGAIGALRDWIDGRDVLVLNGDAYRSVGQPHPQESASAVPLLASLVDSWPGVHPRLFVVDTGHDDPSKEFGRWRFAGASLLPWRMARELALRPSGLYEAVWRQAYAAKRLELIEFAGTFIDCGTPSHYLAANLHASAGATVLGPGAIVEGRAERCVIWPGGVVGSEEDLTEVIRIGQDITIPGPLTHIR